MTEDEFKPGDRVELMLHYSFWGGPLPQATVISTTHRFVRCKMDRNGKLIRLLPQDLRHVHRIVPRKKEASAVTRAGDETPAPTKGRLITSFGAVDYSGTTALRRLEGSNSRERFNLIQKATTGRAGANDGRDKGPLPVKVDATSNGEFRPVPLSEPVARANSEAELRIGDNAKSVGLARRAFLQSLCGAATTFLTLNEAFAAHGNTGGLFRMPKESAFETAAAAEAIAGDEFIFDVQTHMVDPTGAWRSSAGKYWEQILANFLQGSCGDTTRSTASPPSSSSSTSSWTAIPSSRCFRSFPSCRKETAIA